LGFDQQGERGARKERGLIHKFGKERILAEVESGGDGILVKRDLKKEIRRKGSQVKKTF